MFATTELAEELFDDLVTCFQQREHVTIDHPIPCTLVLHLNLRLPLPSLHDPCPFLKDP